MVGIPSFVVWVVGTSSRTELIAPVALSFLIIHGLRVPLPTALQPGEQAVIQMDFRVEVGQEMASRYGLFGYFDSVLVLDEFYPVIPVYDDEGWNVQAPPPNADTSYFDISFYLVRVTAPANLTVAASGIEVSRESEGGQQTLTYAAGPMRDFYLAASEHYSVVSETVAKAATTASKASRVFITSSFRSSLRHRDRLCVAAGPSTSLPYRS